jgi:DNA-binding transcriptional LysR family regulator
MLQIEMNLQKIYYFIKVVELGNVRLAAEELFISRQALSKQLLQLEEEIGEKLFDRATNPLVITEVGKKVYSLYQPIIQNIRLADREIAQFVQYKHKYLKIAYFNALPFDTLVNPFIEAWKQAYPDAIINIVAADAGMGKELLLNDSVDILIVNVLNPNDWKGVVLFPLMTKPLKILVSEKHPWYEKDTVTEEEIAEYTMLVYGNRPIYGEKVFMSQIKPKERMVMYNVNSYMDNLRQGYAFGVVSEVPVNQGGNFKLIDLPKSLQADMCFALLYKPLHPLNNKIKKIGKLLQYQLKEK